MKAHVPNNTCYAGQVPTYYTDLHYNSLYFSQITTIRLQDISSDFRTNCSACTKLITLNELQKLNVKPRCLSKKPGLQEGDAAKTPPDNEDKRPLKKQSRHSDRQKLKGIKKMKERSKLALNIKKIANRSCQCVIDDKHNETPATLRAIKSSLGTNVQNVVCEEMDSKPHNEEQPATKTSIQQNSKKNSKQDLKSRNPSNSSYNSYLSMDHEPMD